ncbi:MAG: putative immunity protein [Pseudothermotoga sp.]
MCLVEYSINENFGENMKDIRLIVERFKEHLKAMDKKVAMLWALDCAQKVLCYFEISYPFDLRPRTALQTARQWLEGTVSFKQIRRSALDAHAAARQVNDLKASYAARSCAHAVATAHVITHAAGAALYALKVFEQIDPELVEKELSWQFKRLVQQKGEQNEL